MSRPKLTDEIDRLFDQLVRGPWTRGPQRPRRLHGAETVLEITLPLPPGERGGVSVALEGRRLMVRSDSLAERVITLPEGAEVTGLEAEFEGATLHVRVHLQTAGGPR